eukprot:TRINITY_DN4320_c0_g1_i1.p1 TRINITY_DN4320_c0_g1~~TRINITY_DN4320_c0_g1_i1.p1  ORF type:complete len:163 (+),score=4.83 TRINITY_DN4320_c0_g1_i1:530-1018(+)
MLFLGAYHRYRRWNPVHLTAGSFWGFGFGVGCGVGWGPGFGPDIAGNVGSGCGVGFSIGLTLIGVGLGLPARGPVTLPSRGVRWGAQNVKTFTHSHIFPPLQSSFINAHRYLTHGACSAGQQACLAFDSWLVNLDRVCAEQQASLKTKCLELRHLRPNVKVS